MEFGWSDRHLRYREQVREALTELLPADWSETVGRDGMGSPAQIAFSREFCPKLAERGLLVPHWPAAYGGSEGDPWEQFILAEEMKVAGEPASSSNNAIGVAGARAAGRRAGPAPAACGWKAGR